MILKILKNFKHYIRSSLIKMDASRKIRFFFFIKTIVKHNSEWSLRVKMVCYCFTSQIKLFRLEINLSKDFDFFSFFVKNLIISPYIRL